MKIILLDIKKVIASYNEDVYFKMTRIDDEFKEFAFSDIGKRHFVRLFKKVGMDIEANKYTSIFGRKHSFNDEPASINRFSGVKIWYYNGLRHRPDQDGQSDLPAYESRYCNMWYKNGLKHREGDLPTVVSAGILEWHYNGLLHRLNSHAIWNYGSRRRYYLNGINYDDYDSMIAEQNKNNNIKNI
jgi:hypothetical protein